MADLTEAQEKSYWRYNITLTTVLLVIWFELNHLLSALRDGRLNRSRFLGVPLIYNKAGQGPFAIFVVAYAHLMNKLNVDYGQKLKVLKLGERTPRGRSQKLTRI